MQDDNYLIYKEEETIVMPSEISDGRVDALIKALDLIKSPHVKKIHFNWYRTQTITPAGYAILACLFDSAVEQQTVLTHRFLKKHLQQNQVVQNLLKLSDFDILPPPQIHEFIGEHFILGSGEKGINIHFIENFHSIFESLLSDNLLFSCQLILNELMQNCADHSNAERYYLYAGLHHHEMHVGVVDMGCTIPGKMEQKYNQDHDVGYLELSLKEGISTRRQRPGGLGLTHVFDLLKQESGTFTILSRRAQLRRYFKNRVVQRSRLKQTLQGSWCFARLPVEKILEKTGEKNEKN